MNISVTWRRWRVRSRRRKWFSTPKGSKKISTLGKKNYCSYWICPRFELSSHFIMMPSDTQRQTAIGWSCDLEIWPSGLECLLLIRLSLRSKIVRSYGTFFSEHYDLDLWSFHLKFGLRVRPTCDMDRTFRSFWPFNTTSFSSIVLLLRTYFIFYLSIKTCL